MQLFIPYNNADISISTTLRGELELAIPDNQYLLQSLLHQLFEVVSYQEFINTIGPQEFEAMIDYYHTEFDKE